MKFKIKPYEWQLNALRKSSNLSNMAIFAEMGTGKTACQINILRSKFYNHGKLLKTLIFSPLVTLYNWEDEILTHSTIKNDKIFVLSGTSHKKKKKFIDGASSDGITLDKSGIAITNYETTLSKDFLSLVDSWGPEVLVLDESHYVKNHQSKRFKAIKKIADATRARGGYVFIMTGTPILNTPMDVWAQYRILDGGETLGDNFYVFRNIYFQDENAAWSSRDNHFAKYVPRVQMYEDLNKKIYSKAVRVLKSECLDLPPLVKEIRKTELNKEQKKAYKEMERDLLTFVNSHKGESSAAVANATVVKALRLQQIVSGFIKTEDDEEISFGMVPRLKYTKELLSDLCIENKVILWCSFKYNYKQLAKICKDLDLEYVTITGEQNGSEKQEAVRAFNTDPDIKVCIGNRRAAGIGINLVSAAYSIVYSRNFSLGEELQSEARNHRGGSEVHKQIVKIDLVAPETIDETVLEALSKKQKVSEVIIDSFKR